MSDPIPSPFYPNSPIAIRNHTAARVAAAAPALTKVFTNRGKPGQDQDLPYAVVWYAGEKTGPNGDANAGAPGFVHHMTLVVDVMAKATDEDTLDTELVNLTETIRSGLLSDLSWVMLVEGIERCDTRYSYPKEAAEITAQAMIEFEVTYRTIWQPITPNDLLRVVVTALPKRSPVSCTYCGTINDGDANCCSVCAASFPAPTEPVTTTIALEGTSP